MLYSKLGNTGLIVSRLCLGTMSFGEGGGNPAIARTRSAEAEALVGRALDAGIKEALGTRRRVTAVSRTRGLTRADLVANTAVPQIEVSSQDGQVTVGGRVLACEPVDAVPMSRRYLLV